MDANLELRRNATVQRLELTKFFELFADRKPWKLLRNPSYDLGQQPNVSVIVTLYNYSNYIYECLDSVCASKLDGLPNGFEIIVIDDHSTDNSLQLAQDYLEKRSDIPICLVQKLLNTGLADSRNIGLELARAPYVFILDADNWIYPTCLSTLYQEIEKFNAAAVYGMIERVDHATRQSLGTMSNVDWNVYELVRCPYIDAMAMFRRDSILAVGGYSTELIQFGWFGWEDYDLWLKLAQADYTCRLVPQILSGYRVHSDSMINKTNYYVPWIAQYFNQKFHSLIQKFDGIDRLFGGPYTYPPTQDELEAKVEQRDQQIQQTQAELQQAQTGLQQTQAELQQAQAELQKMQQSHTEVETKLYAVETELSHVRSRLGDKQTKLKALRERLQLKHTSLELAQSRITAMETSKFWQLRTSWLKFKRAFGLTQEDVSPFVVLPPEQFLQAKQEVRPQLQKPSEQSTQPQPTQPPKVSQVDAYEQWMRQNTPTQADLDRMADIASVMNYKPLISVIVPTYNTPEQFLREAIESVIAQVYPHWELCIADDASTQPHVRQVLEEYANQDERVKVIFREENGHISRCSNSALELATGEYIALLDHDDALPPEALYEVAFLLNLHPEADMIYSDEDKLDADGKRRHPYFKPDWCPDNFLSRMYTCHLGVYRRSIVDQIGGFRVGYEGSQDYDLVLRFTEQTDKIFHIPKILYHWRIHEGSVTSGASAKPYAYEAGKRALVDALQRRGEEGEVISSTKIAGVYTIRYKIKSPGLVSIIIPTKNYGQLLNQCLESIFTKSTYSNFEVIIIDNGSTEAYTEKVITDWLNKEPERVRCYSLGIPFNYSKINNYAVTKAKGEYLLFLNNDTEVIAPDWIEAMVEQAQRPSIGAVGALLLYPDDTVQHAGIVMGLYGFAAHSHKHFPADALGYSGQLIATSNYSAVTGACFMCRREVFEQVGGFDETLAVACNDVELCLRILSKGWRNIYLPHVTLYHYESKSRGYEDTPEKKARFVREMEYVIERWKSYIEHDPCYNPNLTRDRDDFSLREPKNTEVDNLNKQLKQLQKKLQKAQSKLDQVQQEKEEAIGRVSAMETSKFWRLRKRWFEFKQLAGLPGQE